MHRLYTILKIQPLKISVFTIVFTAFVTIGLAQSIKKSMLRLPDTGVTKSYTNTFGEDNDYNYNVPYFIDNGDGTITDTITGLMWQKTDGGEMTVENARKYCSELSLGNYTDWRLPTAHEAYSILNHQNAKPALDATAFTKTAAEYWWTSDVQINDTTKIWVTNAGGGIGNHAKKETVSAGGTKKIHVLAVRDVYPATMVDKHFTLLDNGLIHDNITNLTWQKLAAQDSMTWEDALKYATASSTANYSDWRMPNIKELQSLNDEKYINPSIDKNTFTNIEVSKYWSSTTLPNQTDKAWYLDTRYGITTYLEKTRRLKLLLVRGNGSIATTTKEETKVPYTLYPNPVHDKIFIDGQSEDMEISLYTLQGGFLYCGKDIQNFNLSALPCGIYILSITYLNKIQKHTIVKL